MGYPTLKEGQRNPAVAALQAGLHRALASRGIEHENLRNGAYGTLTRRDVARFKRAFYVPSGPVTGKVAGSDLWRNLEPFLGPYDHQRIDRTLRMIEAARDAAEQTAVDLVHAVGSRAALAAVWVRFYAECRDTYVYGQVRPMPSGLFVPEARTRLDCSSTFKLGYREVGLAPPDGVPYESGAGWTGTLWAAGERVQVARPGDGVFYGWDADRGAPKHVACAISSTEVVSFGHTPIERYPLRYRSDFLGIRSYLT